MHSNDRFSLERLEYLAYRRSHEEAAAEVIRLLGHLSKERGGLGDIGQAASGSFAAEQRDAHFATRIACAVTALFSDPNFQLSEPGFRRLIPLQRWLATIFGASPLGNADHIIHLFSELGYERTGRIQLKDRDLLKFCLLYSPDSAIPLQPDILWAKDKRMAAGLFMALLSSRIIATEQAHAKREELLRWLPPRLKELSLDEFPVEILHDVWMHCSYAQRADKHNIKRVINELVRTKLLAAGFGDMHGTPSSTRDKPVVLCVLEWFNSSHSMYRGHSASIESLKTRYRLVGVSLREASDEISRRMFDEIHILARGQSAVDTVRQISELAAEVRPDLIYYPSVGMFPDTVFLVNLRLAPIQLAGLGHPATTHSPFIDYVLIEEDYIGDPNCFSEKVVGLPRESFPYRPPANCPRISPEIRRAPEPVRIAIAASLMKINPVFLDVLRRVAGRTRVEVEFHFFSLGSLGLTKVYLQNLVHAVLPGWAVVYPNLPYERYLQNINRCDMFLNPFPFGNTNGIVDTVRQGLPGVCLTGPEIHSHIDEGLFRRLGLPEWLITTSPEEYVQAAIRLAESSAEREELSRQILKIDPDSVLFQGNPALFVNAVEWIHENHRQHMRAASRLLRPPATEHSASHPAPPRHSSC
jgi:hypothetical protein